MLDDTIKAKLQKIKALADGGFGHEAALARMKLDAALARYGITEEELADLDKQPYACAYETDWQKALMGQIAWMITGSEKYWSYRDGDEKLLKKVGMEFTKAEKAEFEWLYEHYRDEYQKDLDSLWPAFVNRHRIFGPNYESSDESDLSEEEIARILRMSKGLLSLTAKRHIKPIGYAS